MQWDHGGVNSYRMGTEGKYDLDMTGEEPAIPPPPPEDVSDDSPVEGTQDEEEIEFDDEVLPYLVMVCLRSLHYLLFLERRASK